MCGSHIQFVCVPVYRFDSIFYARTHGEWDTQDDWGRMKRTCDHDITWSVKLLLTFSIVVMPTRDGCRWRAFIVTPAICARHLIWYFARVWWSWLHHEAVASVSQKCWYENVRCAPRNRDSAACEGTRDMQCSSPTTMTIIITHATAYDIA